MRKFFTVGDPVVPMHLPRLLVDTAVSLGADRDALFENVGITSAALMQPEARISYLQFGVLERNALRLTNEPALGLHFGQAIHFSNAGLLGLAAMSSPTLGAAFQLVKQYISLTPGWDLELRVEGARAFLTLRETISRGELLGFATEAMLAGFYALAQDALGRRFPLTELRLSYSRPAHYQKYNELLGDMPIRFDQPVTEAEFDSAILEERVVSADPATSKLAEQYCATEAAQQEPVNGLAAQIRKVLSANGARRIGLEQVARALQTSPRSLRRALSQMGTSYQDIAGEVLRARAEERVRSGHVKIEQIAQELGFADARSFRRAFKRWTGHNPNEFRRQG